MYKTDTKTKTTRVLVLFCSSLGMTLELKASIKELGWFASRARKGLKDEVAISANVGMFF